MSILEQRHHEHLGGSRHLSGARQNCPPLRHSAHTDPDQPLPSEIAPVLEHWKALAEESITTTPSLEFGPSPFATLQDLTLLCGAKRVFDGVITSREELRRVFDFYEQIHADITVDSVEEDAEELQSPETLSAAVATLYELLLSTNPDTKIGAIVTPLHDVRAILSSVYTDLHRLLETRRQYPSLEIESLEMKEPMRVLEELISHLDNLFDALDLLMEERLHGPLVRPSDVEGAGILFDLAASARGKDHPIVRFLHHDQRLAGDAIQIEPAALSNLAHGLASIAYMANEYSLGRSPYNNIDEFRAAVKEVYRQDLAEPFRSVREVYSSLHQSDASTTDEQRNQAWEMLQRTDDIERWMYSPSSVHPLPSWPGDKDGNRGES